MDNVKPVKKKKKGTFLKISKRESRLRDQMLRESPIIWMELKENHSKEGRRSFVTGRVGIVLLSPAKCWESTRGGGLIPFTQYIYNKLFLSPPSSIHIQFTIYMPKHYYIVLLACSHSVKLSFRSINSLGKRGITSKQLQWL